MNAERPESGIGLRHMLAGIGSGVAGGIFLLCFLMLGCAWYHHSIWMIANLFSTAIYGSDAYVDGFAAGSVPGAALVLVIYGIAGAFWGIVLRERQPRFPFLAGAICGAITYFVVFDFFFKRLDPVLWLYAPVRELEIANILWGMIVIRSPRLARRMVEVAEPVQAEAVAVSSGELTL